MTRATWTLLGRHLRGQHAVRDVVVLAAVGTLVAFFTLYLGRLGFDRIRFEVGLTYATQAPGAHAGGVTIRQLDGHTMTSEARSGMVIDTQRNVVTTWLFDDADVAKVQRLVSAPSLTTGGVLVDETRAALLDVAIGTNIVLSCPGTDAVVRARVLGLVTPFHLIGDYGNGGLVIAPASLIEATCGGRESAATTTYSDGRLVAPDARSKASVVWQAIFAEVSVGPLVGLLALVSIVLWSVTMVRITRDLVGLLRPDLRLLIALGQHPRVGRSFILVVLVVTSGVAAVAAVLASRALIHAWTDFHLVAPLTWLVVSVMAVTSGAVAAAVIPVSAKEAL